MAARPAAAGALAIRLSAVERLLQGHSGRAQHLALQLADLQAETRQLASELAAMPGSRSVVSGGHAEDVIASASNAHRHPLTAPKVPDLPAEGFAEEEEGPSTAPSATRRHLPALRNGFEPPFNLPGMPCDTLLATDLDGGQPVPAGDAGVPLGLLPKPRGESAEARPPASLRALQKNSRRVFVDSEDLKEQILNSLLDEAHDTSEYYRKTGWCQYLARSAAFETVSLIVTCVNALWIAIDIDVNRADVLLEAELVFQVMAHFFCAFFVLELLVRVLALKRKFALKEGWLLFDAVLVALMVFETWVMLPIHATGWRLSPFNLRAFAVFRVLRVLRVMWLARVLRNLSELLVIVRAIAVAFRGISIVLALLGLLVYMGAIVFRVLLEGTALGAHRFGNVFAAMATLLLEVTLSGTKGGPVIREAASHHVAYGLLLLVFALLANVTVMGVLTGLLVQTVKTVAQAEKEEAHGKSMALIVDELWALLTEKQGHAESISEQQLTTSLTVKRFAKDLHDLGVDLEGLISASGFIFEQHAGRLSKPQFKRMVLDLRGKNLAKVKDHVETRRFIDLLFKRSGCKSGTCKPAGPC